MFHETQDSLRQALAEYERIKERRIEGLMAMFEENGFYCERDENTKLAILLIWPRTPIKASLEKTTTSDLPIDDVLRDFLEGHHPSDYLI